MRLKMLNQEVDQNVERCEDAPAWPLIWWCAEEEEEKFSRLEWEHESGGLRLIWNFSSTTWLGLLSPYEKEP